MGRRPSLQEQLDEHDHNRELAAAARDAAMWIGPFTAHNAIDCAIIRRDGTIIQTCKTMRGARALANLLNHAVATAKERGAEISPNSGVSPEEIIAHAVARAFDWCLELGSERERRLAEDAEASTAQ